MTHFEETIDILDACVFTGDQLHDEKNRKLLSNHIDRWVAEIEAIERNEDLN